MSDTPQPIEITVCTGTTCYVMGGANLLPLEDHLPEAALSRCTVKGASCLGLCRDRSAGTPPFVSVNGTVISGASVTAVVQQLEELLPDIDFSSAIKE